MQFSDLLQRYRGGVWHDADGSSIRVDELLGADLVHPLNWEAATIHERDGSVSVCQCGPKGPRGAGDYAGSIEPPGGLRQVPCVRDVLAQHRDKVLVHPDGEWCAVSDLLRHIDVEEPELGQAECEVVLDADSCDVPGQAQYWGHGPVLHIYVDGDDRAEFELLGFVIPDKSAVLRTATHDWC